jgi:hypothetical protein
MRRIAVRAVGLPEKYWAGAEGRSVDVCAGHHNAHKRLSAVFKAEMRLLPDRNVTENYSRDRN